MPPKNTTASFSAEHTLQSIFTETHKPKPLLGPPPSYTHFVAHVFWFTKLKIMTHYINTPHATRKHTHTLFKGTPFSLSSMFSILSDSERLSHTSSFPLMTKTTTMSSQKAREMVDATRHRQQRQLRTALWYTFPNNLCADIFVCRRYPEHEPSIYII